MKVKNIVFSGAMASILMMGAAVAEDPMTLTQIKDSIKVSADFASNHEELDGYTVATSGDNAFKVTSNASGKTITTDTVNPASYEVASSAEGGDPITFSKTATDVKESWKVNANMLEGQYATLDIEMRGDGTNAGIDPTKYSMTVGGTDTYSLGADGETLYHNDAAVTEPTETEQGYLTALTKNYGDNKTALETAATKLKSNYDTIAGQVTTDEGIQGALLSYKNNLTAYADSLGADIDNHILDPEGKVMHAVAEGVEIVIADKEENISKQLGYNVANNPENEKEEKSLVNSLKMNEDKTEGKVTSVVGAINANTDAIAQVRSDAEAAWEKGEAWISQELGYDTKTTDAKTELAKVGFESTDFLGALQELDQTDLALSGKIADEATRAMEEEAAIRSEFAAADALTLSSAKAFANAGDELTLSKANAYTDAKVDTLEKNVSGGIAAATALSAVEVSNVKRGEMSVGGGYGYYNGQSAGAFGMAMGLSDNWSVNAGAGIASGDKTQVSFRAGTNYKFKLF